MEFSKRATVVTSNQSSSSLLPLQQPNNNTQEDTISNLTENDAGDLSIQDDDHHTTNHDYDISYD